MKLRFRYRNAKGEESLKEPDRWAEQGQYILVFGVSGRELQFLKWRVLEYLDGSDALLADPYTPPPALPSPKAPEDERPRILFTCFKQTVRAELERLAEETGFRVMKSRGAQGLAFLCMGPERNAPVKLLHAREQGATVLGQVGFLWMCETGEIPDPEMESSNQ